MNKIIGLAAGMALGAAVGMLLAVAFAPVSGRELRASLHEGYQEAKEDARKAGEARRQQLQGEYSRLVRTPLLP